MTTHVFGPLAVAGILGQAVGLAPVVVATTRDATGGSMQPLSLISGSAGLCLAAAIGCAIGLVWSRAAAPVVAALATYAVIVGPALATSAMAGNLENGTMGKSFLAAAPAWIDFRLWPGQREVVALSAVRLMLFCLTTIAVIGAAVALTEQLDRHRVRKAIALAALPVVITAILAVRQPHLVEDTGDVACQQATNTERTPDEPRVCVAAEMAALLPGFIEGTRAITQRFGLGAATEPIRSGVPMSDLATFWMGAPNEHASAGAAAAAVARHVAGVNACFEALPSELTERMIEVSSGLASTLARRTGLVAPSDFPNSEIFNKLSDDQRRELLTAHSAELQDCSFDPVELLAR